MSGEASYVTGGNNHVLRLVLYDLYQSRCYVCLRPADYNEVQVDHIVAKKTENARLAVLLAEHGLPADFDLNDPANLAPICGACNGPLRKGQVELSGPQLDLALAKARRLRPKVIKNVLSFHASRDLAEAVLTVRQADMRDGRVRDLLQSFGPGLVQSLARLDEDLVDYRTYRELDVISAGEPIVVTLSLDRRAREAKALLENLTGQAIDDLLEGPIVALHGELLRDVQTEIEAVESPNGEANSGPPVSTDLRISLDSIQTEGTLNRVEFTFAGVMEGSFASSVVRSSADGSELDELQGEVYLTAGYTFHAWARIDDAVDLEISEPSIDAWEAEVDIV